MSKNQIILRAQEFLEDHPEHKDLSLITTFYDEGKYLEIYKRPLSWTEKSARLKQEKKDEDRRASYNPLGDRKRRHSPPGDSRQRRVDKEALTIQSLIPIFKRKTVREESQQLTEYLLGILRNARFVLEEVAQRGEVRDRRQCTMIVNFLANALEIIFRNQNSNVITDEVVGELKYTLEKANLVLEKRVRDLLALKLSIIRCQTRQRQVFTDDALTVQILQKQEVEVQNLESKYNAYKASIQPALRQTEKSKEEIKGDVDEPESDAELEEDVKQVIKKHVEYRQKTWPRDLAYLAFNVQLSNCIAQAFNTLAQKEVEHWAEMISRIEFDAFSKRSDRDWDKFVVNDNVLERVKVYIAGSLSKR